MNKTYILLLSLYLTLLGQEQTVVQDTNATTNISDNNSIPQKTVNFFSGIVDDIREFAADNNLIDKSKR